MEMRHKLLFLMVFGVIFSIRGSGGPGQPIIMKSRHRVSYTALLREKISDPSATMEDIKYCLDNGANIEWCNSVEYEGGKIESVDFHTSGFAETGRSPIGGKVYVGNKEVMSYVFCVLLNKRLDRAIASSARPCNSDEGYDFWFDFS